MITMKHPGPMMRLEHHIRGWIQTVTHPVLQGVAKNVSDHGGRSTMLLFLGEGVLRIV